MLKRSLAITVALSAAFTGNALAQAGWDAPTFFSPRPMDDVGIYAFKTDFERIDDATGLKLIWRQSGNLNLGLHAGAADLGDIGNTILLGGEFYGPLTGATASTGLIMSWGLGAGAVFGSDYIDLSIPLGVSIGMNLGTGGVSLLPYVHPRVSLDVTAIGEGENEQTDTNIGLSVDLGVDVGLGERFILRAGGSFGDRDAYGVGIAMRIPRKVSVR